ncbi:MAG: cyclic-di-AMP phosphodiesterase PgpH [Thermosipho sp. (in: thermotogales)]|nr:cyclic-di-AMP phosphodiesterase PgpH [Thermosipho sp. (in: thermotogales)]MDN5324574.1 cyclic-di-AMP phosphodiesterase PgpH [Thermosipho sp. (in: thermotogales)]
MKTMKRENKIEMFKILKNVKPRNFEGLFVSILTMIILNLFDLKILQSFNEFIILIFMWYFVVELLLRFIYHFRLHYIYRFTFYFLFLLGILTTYPFIEQFGFVISPFLISSLLLTLLMSYEVGITVGILQALLISLHLSNFVIFYYFIPQIILMNFLIRNVNRRIEIARAALLTSFLAIILIGLQPTYFSFYNLTIAVLNPFVSTVLILGLLPYIEYFTRIYSNIGLSELANMNHPLLKKLSIQAPGTYYHSIMVATLAEAAAERIGVNSTFTRVASYFHDIGKIKRPYFFVENLSDKDENPHEKISPFLSHIILEDHIKSGIELARKYKLPLRIEFIIPQHHGTRVQKYFYYKAKQIDPETSEEAFKYPGPKPQFKEAGIIMLADSVEAALKSINSSNYQSIKEVVEEIVSGIYNERQLDESGLNLRELELIVEEFIKVIINIKKERIEYPKEDIQKVVQINDLQ